MRIVFMGTPEFSVPILNALLTRAHDQVVGVFTQPDRPKGRGKKLMPSPVKERALQAGIPVFQPEKIRRDGVDDLRSLQPDLCVTAAFGQILSQEILDIPPLGNINVHASLLPAHRGSAPIAHAIMAGDKTAGVTTMMMDAGIDTGDMLLKAETEIGERETCGELTERLSMLGAQLILQTLDQMEQSALVRVPQNEKESSYDPMLNKSMSIVDFHEPAFRVRGIINGLNPWPCVSVPYENGRLKLLRADVISGSGTPGTILQSDPRKGLVIACGEQAVRIIEVQAPGGKPLKTEEFLKGHSIPEGTNVSEDRA